MWVIARYFLQEVAPSPAHILRNNSTKTIGGFVISYSFPNYLLI